MRRNVCVCLGYFILRFREGWFVCYVKYTGDTYILHAKYW